MDVAELNGLHFGTLEMIDVRGTSIEIFRAGIGAPLLFLHGMDGLEGSVALLQELAQSYDVYAPSHPGFGASELPKGMDRVDDMAYFYLDMLDLLELDAPLIVGASFGGWVACEMLTKAPGRAQALVLASPLGVKTADRRAHWVADIFMISKQEFAQRLQFGPPEGPELRDMTEGQMRRALRADEALSLYGWTPYMCNPKLTHRLHRITCPSLIIWGDKDAMIQPEYRERWAETMPQASVQLLPDAGHRSHADKPADLRALIGDFFARAAS